MWQPDESARPDQWETLPPHTTNLSLPLSSQSVHQIAVAANYQAVSSGLQWSTCTISNRAGTVSRVTEVMVSRATSASSQLRVSWTLYCSKMGNIVNSFLVSVCDEAGECRLSTAQPWEESVLCPASLPSPPTPALSVCWRLTVTSPARPVLQHLGDRLQGRAHLEPASQTQRRAL